MKKYNLLIIFIGILVAMYTTQSLIKDAPQKIIDIKLGIVNNRLYFYNI